MAIRLTCRWAALNYLNVPDKSDPLNLGRALAISLFGAWLRFYWEPLGHVFQIECGRKARRWQVWPKPHAMLY